MDMLGKDNLLLQMEVAERKLMALGRAVQVIGETPPPRKLAELFPQLVVEPLPVEPAKPEPWYLRFQKGRNRKGKYRGY